MAQHYNTNVEKGCVALLTGVWSLHCFPGLQDNCPTVYIIRPVFVSISWGFVSLKSSKEIQGVVYAEERCMIRLVYFDRSTFPVWE